MVRNHNFFRSFIKIDFSMRADFNQSINNQAKRKNKRNYYKTKNIEHFYQML